MPRKKKSLEDLTDGIKLEMDLSDLKKVVSDLVKKLVKEELRKKEMHPYQEITMRRVLLEWAADVRHTLMPEEVDSILRKIRIAAKKLKANAILIDDWSFRLASKK